MKKFTQFLDFHSTLGLKFSKKTENLYSAVAEHTQESLLDSSISNED